MIQSSYHIHTTYCDGKSSLQEMLKSSEAHKLTSVGISSHAPLLYPNDWTMTWENLPLYLKELELAKGKYPYELYAGLEVDFYLDIHSIDQRIKQIIGQLDYWIGSIHCIGKLESNETAYIDDTVESMEAGINQIYHGDAKKFVQDYFNGIGEMALNEKPDIIGHIDIIKKNNCDNYFFDENKKWYRNAWNEALEKIQCSGSILEINTGGAARYGKRCLYPALPILKRARELKIPITVDSDAHSAENICFGYDDLAVNLMKEAGYKEIFVLFEGNWVSQAV